ncbi:MAG: hypothetical protein V4548_07450 [Bacteroidota bacterium]
MKKLLLTLTILIVSHSNCIAQKDFLDYIVTTKNDTIYGTFRTNVTGKVLFEKNLQPEKNGIRFYSHSLNEAKSYRINDKIHYINVYLEDGIYTTAKEASKTVENKIEKLDYVVTLKNDTILRENQESVICQYLLERQKRQENKN